MKSRIAQERKQKFTMKELREIVASNICALRNERKITQLKLAEILNYSDKAVSKWERGESLPDVSVLKQIADYFDVSVDYLLSEDHSGEIKKKKNYTKQANRNHLIISTLAVVLVWLIGTFVFVEMNIIGSDFPSWLMFIYSLPVSFIVMIVFNSIWGIPRLNFIIISALVWSLILTVYLTVLTVASLNIWLVFILGIPAQLIVILWSGLRKLNKR